MLTDQVFPLLVGVPNLKKLHTARWVGVGVFVLVEVRVGVAVLVLVGEGVIDGV